MLYFSFLWNEYVMSISRCKECLKRNVFKSCLLQDLGFLNFSKRPLLGAISYGVNERIYEKKYS